MSALANITQSITNIPSHEAITSPTTFSSKIEDKYLVNQPVLSLHEASSESSSYVTQAIYGHRVDVVERNLDGWAKMRTEDGYEGYGKLDGLILDNPCWRTSQTICRTASVTALIYAIADTEKPPILKLPFGSRLKLMEGLDSSDTRWIRAELINGRECWVQRGDVEPFEVITLAKVVELSQKFLERPYIWGGTSSEGFDCSGFVQTLYKQMGVLLPRDSRPQANSNQVREIEQPEKPGDLLFFGSERIAHVAMHLGNGHYIHSGVWLNSPKVCIAHLSEAPRALLASRRVKKLLFEAHISPISSAIKEKMIHSWRDNNPVALYHLRYIRLLHWGFDNCIHSGELIVHEKVAESVVCIFRDLFQAKYPIEKMLLVDAYQANDELSCQDNNTSAFCSRFAVGKDEWSCHSYGLAIDINPLLNPYQNGELTVPENGLEFLNREQPCRGVITHEDLCYKAFTSSGWLWGGDWKNTRGYVDYQHFYFPDDYLINDA